MSNPRQIVTGPTFTPIPFGILSVAQVIDDPDPHWRNGVEWEETGCSPAAKGTLSPCYEVVDQSEGADPEVDRVEADPPAKTPSTDGVAYGDGDGFTLYAEHKCATIGRTTQADLDRATRLLVNGEARGLDEVLTTGVTEAGLLIHRLVDAVPASSPAGSVTRAILTLESILGTDYGGLGVIYLNRGLATAGFHERVLIVNGQRITTQLGTPVAVLSSQVFDDPNDPTSIFAYATGALTVYRGAPIAFGAIDRKVNTNVAIAERDYAVAWDCLTASASVALDSLP